MFLSQARLTRGLHVVAVADLNVERARSQLATAGWPAEQFAAASLGDALKQRTHPRHRRRAGADRASRHRGDRRGDRHPRGRHRPCAQGDRARQAHRHGQRRGRRARRPAARAQGQGRRRGLQPRLGRPAGADLRARRLGARLRLQGGRGRQGHALRAALSPVQSRQRLGHPRQVPQHHRPQVDQSEDVQLASSTAPSPASR